MSNFVLGVILAAVAGVVLGALWFWFFVTVPVTRKKEALAAEKRELAAELKERGEALIQARTEVTVLRTKLDAAEKQDRDRLEQIKDAKAQLTAQFQSIAAEALGRNNQTFLDLANQNWEKHSKAAADDLSSRQAAIQSMIKPLSENLGKFETRVNDIEKSRENAYAGITQQIHMLNSRSKSLEDETGRLVQALRAPKTRGRWGEMQLRQVFEMAGMVEHVDFEREKSFEGDEGGKLRPDAIVRLPGGKSIVVDAKTPLAAYLEAIEATDSDVHAEALQRHATQLRTHVRQLSAKEYWSRLPATPDFVVMFIPGEAIYSAALENDANILEDSFNLRVLIATPTTLIALVKAIAYGWQQEKLTENARQVADTARELYDRLAIMGGHFSRIGKALSQSVKYYNESVGSLEGRVLPKAREFERLGVSTSRKSLPPLEQVEAEPRSLNAPEFDDSDAGRR